MIKDARGGRTCAPRLARYLLSVPVCGRVALLNTRSSALALAPESLWREGAPDSSLAPGLERLGILVEEGADELAELSRVRDERRLARLGRGLESAVVAPTTACNARCWYCFEEGARTATMSPETAAAAAAYLDARCTGRRLEVGWFGGEPLVAADAIDRVAAGLVARGVALTSHVTTNGYLADAAMARRMLSWGVHACAIPLDGVGEAYERAKAYPGDPRAFRRVAANVEGLLAAGIAVRVLVNYLPVRLADAEGAVEWALGNLADAPGLTVKLVPLLQGRAEPPRAEARTALEGLRARLREAGLEEGWPRPGAEGEDDALLEYFDLRAKDGNCRATLDGSVTVGPEGELYRCRMFLGCGSDFTCGDVWSGEREPAPRRYMGPPWPTDRCESCPILPLCQGGCGFNNDFVGVGRLCSEERCAARVEAKRRALAAYVEELLRRRGEGAATAPPSSS